MEVDRISKLQQGAKDSEKTVESARDLLSIIERIIAAVPTTVEAETQTNEGKSEEESSAQIGQQGLDGLIPIELRDSIKASQRSFVLDSFNLTLFQTKFKSWEHSYSSNFTETTISQYNKVLGQMAICSSQKEAMDKEYTLLMTSVELPKFAFSKSAFERFLHDEEEKKGDSDANSSVLIGESPFTNESTHSTLDHIYSVSPTSPLPFPQFEEFNRLVNAEYRLRIEKRIKYEILEAARNRLTASNEKWKARVARLDKFLDNVEVILEEVETIQAEGFGKRATQETALDESDSDDEEERDRLERDRQAQEDREESEERLDDDDKEEGFGSTNIDELETEEVNNVREVADTEAESHKTSSESVSGQEEGIPQDELGDAMIID